MPELVRLYIRNVLVGFGLSAVFVGLLLWFNIANLWQLVSTSPVGWIALAMLLFFNGALFAGAQFAISVMRLEEHDGTPGGGRRVPVATNIPARIAVPVEASASASREKKPLR
ncbi:MAG: hypothetical protein CSA74_02025 [Rhodobacterales bacterium]|nr:MAG: hypothetical protein CSA74_02025 [Rhodobacterales bacterium]